MEFEITTVRGEEKNVRTDGIYAFGEKQGQPWSEEQLH